MRCTARKLHRTIPLPTLGLVLAGGLARRMGGGDKARIEIGGVTILDRVLATLSGQCTDIIINANGDPERFADTGCPVVPDNVPGHPGPLAGILAGLDWLAEQDNGVEWIVSVPGDCPFLPDDLVERLHQARRQMGTGVPLACARSGEWRHPAVGLVAAGAARATCARRWSRRTCARSRCGPAATASPSPTGRRNRSTPSSTSTRRKTPRAPARIALQHAAP